MVPRSLRQALALLLVALAAVSALRRGPRSFTAPPEPGQAVRPSTVVDINRASREELESLPGVGPTLAARIISGRPYARVDDLRRVRGIGERTLARIRDRARVSEVAQEADPDGGRQEVRGEVAPHEGERVRRLE